MTTTTPPLPKALQVEVTAACNLRCPMCLVRYRPALDRTAAGMAFDAFKRLVDAMPELEVVTLQGLGEPLMAPDLFRMIEYAAARSIRAGFNTNATLLTATTAERLVRSGLAWLHVSIDGAHDASYEGIREGARFDKVRRNVAGLAETRRRLGSPTPSLCVVFVAMRRNVRELPDLVRLTADWGIEALRVQNLSHSFSDTDPAGAYRAIRDFAAAEALWDRRDGELEAIFAEARRLAGRLGVRLRLPEPEEPRGGRPAGVPGCDWPWRAAYVTHDGRVQPCCMLMGADRAVLGDLRGSGFAAVWHGAAYREFRAQLLGDAPPAVCRGCAMYRGVF